MRCQKAKKLISLYVAPDGPWLSPKDSHALEVHMAMCERCREDCRESREVIGILQKCWRVSEDTAALLEKGRQGSPHRISASIIKLHGVSRRVAVWAVAASLVIAVLIGLVSSNREAVLTGPIHSVALTGEDLPLVIKLANGGHIIPGAVIQTSAGETRSLVLNGRHRVVMNAGTKLSIQSPLEAGKAGYLMSLALGEVYVHVEHDGNPFVVATARGRAVITGTTFNVKATENSTTLVVTEGTVRFESENGVVKVAAGQMSEMVGHLAPTKPVSCNAAELTAWATGHEVETTLAQAQSASGIYEYADLGLPAVSGPIDLEKIDYGDWIEEKRHWFKREFPWIFQLKDTLEKEGIEVDYPELLMQSGDIWQFVYPQVSPERFPVFSPDLLLKAVSQYGFNEQWLVKNISTARFTNDNHATTSGRFTGLKAFEQWTTYLKKAQKSSEELGAGTLLYSVHAGTYLVNTKTLMWLCVKNNGHVIKGENQAEVLDLLQSEVNAANKLTNNAINLLWTSRQGQPCDEYPQLVGDIIGNIGEIIHVEEKIAKYEISK